MRGWYQRIDGIPLNSVRIITRMICANDLILCRDGAAIFFDERSVEIAGVERLSAGVLFSRGVFQMCQRRPGPRLFYRRDKGNR